MHEAGIEPAPQFTPRNLVFGLLPRGFACARAFTNAPLMLIISLNARSIIWNFYYRSGLLNLGIDVAPPHMPAGMSQLRSTPQGKRDVYAQGARSW